LADSAKIVPDMVMKEKWLSTFADNESDKLPVLLADEIQTEKDWGLLTGGGSERVILCATVNTAGGSRYFFGRAGDQPRFKAAVQEEAGKKVKRLCLGEIYFCDQGLINRILLEGPPGLTEESTESVRGLFSKISLDMLAKEVNVIWGDGIKYVFRKV
jgi:hypothetical protein